MSFELRWSPEARDHLAVLSAYQRARVIDGARTQLLDRPSQPTRNRKLLRRNPLATWELRLGDLRVFYNVDEGDLVVRIVAIGVKTRNRLLIGKQEIQI